MIRNSKLWIYVRPIANDNALVVVAGCACRTNLSKHKTNCTDCSKLLHILAQLQEQQSAASNVDCGGLCVPSDQFVYFITNCEL